VLFILAIGVENSFENRGWGMMIELIAAAIQNVNLLGVDPS
jgi:hypothetical protein